MYRLESRGYCIVFDVFFDLSAGSLCPRPESSRPALVRGAEAYRPLLKENAGKSGARES